MSDFETLLRQNTAKRLPTSGLYNGVELCNFKTLHSLNSCSLYIKDTNNKIVKYCY
jgi:hypothetical protein